MKQTCITIALLASLASASVATAQQPAPQKRLYCWNENGKRVCGDALPPDKSGTARTEFSANSGRALSEVERALTPEERAARQEAAAQEKLTAEVEAARIRRDLAMVESYAAEADLQRAFSERIVLVDESIKTSLLGETNMRSGLVALLSQAADLELAGKPVPKPLQNNILKQHTDLSRQVQILKHQREERGTLDADLADALRRYRELKAASEQSASTQPAAAANSSQ